MKFGELGARNSTTRTAEQTTIGRFWFLTGARSYNPMVHQVAKVKNIDLVDCTRLFALVSMAGMDAYIANFCDGSNRHPEPGSVSARLIFNGTVWSDNVTAARGSSFWPRYSSVRSGLSVRGWRRIDRGRSARRRLFMSTRVGPSCYGPLTRHLGGIRGGSARSRKSHIFNELSYHKTVVRTYYKAACVMSHRLLRTATVRPAERQAKERHARAHRQVLRPGAGASSTRRSPRWAAWWSGCWHRASTPWKSAIRKLAEAAAASDRAIDALERDIQELTILMIAKRQPHGQRPAPYHDGAARSPATWSASAIWPRTSPSARSPSPARTTPSR